MFGFKKITFYIFLFYYNKMVMSLIKHFFPSRRTFEDFVEECRQQGTTTSIDINLISEKRKTRFFSFEPCLLENLIADYKTKDGDVSFKEVIGVFEQYPEYETEQMDLVVKTGRLAIKKVQEAFPKAKLTVYGNGRELEGLELAALTNY